MWNRGSALLRLVLIKHLVLEVLQFSDLSLVLTRRRRISYPSGLKIRVPHHVVDSDDYATSIAHELFYGSIIPGEKRVEPSWKNLVALLLPWPPSLEELVSLSKYVDIALIAILIENVMPHTRPSGQALRSRERGWRWE